ncbi:MAG: biopolymer transporter ExbD [Planctomycetaceae bacterium]
MRRRLRRHRLDAEVQLNMAAMLDMAFQLLAFFILTFRPSPFEGQLLLRLPPPVPLARPMMPLPDDQVPTNPNALFQKSLDIWLPADAAGGLSGARVGLSDAFSGPANSVNLAKLDAVLRQVFALQGDEVDQVMLHVAPGLLYEDLMKIIDVCMRQKLPDGRPVRTINFTELTQPSDGN